MFASFWRNLWNGNTFCVFIVRVTLIKIANMYTTSQINCASSVINWTYCSCTGIRQMRQIRLEIWQEPDLTGFPKMARFRTCRSGSRNTGTTPPHTFTAWNRSVAIKMWLHSCSDVSRRKYLRSCCAVSLVWVIGHLTARTLRRSLMPVWHQTGKGWLIKTLQCRFLGRPHNLD